MAVNLQEAAPPQAAIDFNLQRQEAIQRVQRNAIAADLRQIQTDLRLDLLQERRGAGEQLDAKTVLILEWHQRFTRSLTEREHPQQVFDEFKGLMQQILVDSIFRSALDANCLLGSDGGTYTEMGMQIYRNMAPAQFQNRSPLHPQNERPLLTTPHVCARYMVNWLIRHNVNHRNAQNGILEAAFRQLNLQAQRLPAPRPAVDQDEAMRQIMAHQARRRMQREREQNEQIQASHIQFEQQRRENLIPQVRNGFARVEQRINDVAQQQINQARELNEHINREINVLQPIIDHLEEEIIDLDRRERGLEEQNQRAQQGIDGLRSTHTQLAAETTQLKKQIKENEKAGIKLIANALLTIGACALATYVIQCAIAASGASGVTVGIKPAQGGGLLQTNFKI